MSAREVQAMVRPDQLMTPSWNTPALTVKMPACAPSAGACTSSTAPATTLARRTVVDSADVCTNPPCYRTKEEAHKTQVRQRAVASGCEIITGREAKALIPTAYTGSIEGHVRLDVATEPHQRQALALT